MKIDILAGTTALSSFKSNQLIQTIKENHPEIDIKAIHSNYFYILESNYLNNDDLTKCKDLLNAHTPLNFFKDHALLVTPRKGTISPWASKTLEIFKISDIFTVSRIERGIVYDLRDSNNNPLKPDQIIQIQNLFFDRMTEGIYSSFDNYFEHIEPITYQSIPLLEKGIEALFEANTTMGLALSDQEINYLNDMYIKMNRDPHDIELMMFGQVNSEHCRHKIFNAKWIIDGNNKDMSLFQMIKNTHQKNPDKTIIAYKDNSSVIEGFESKHFEINHDLKDPVYQFKDDQMDILMKVETHNHPTAISPYPGAATGVGGEIRDEGATGIGGKPKAGLCAFFVSNLHIDHFKKPWEKDRDFPEHIKTPFEIMTQGPIGGARFGNEFGRPQLCGIFKTFEESSNDKNYGYHKPIMLAGGMGNIKRRHCAKKDIEKDALIYQIGGPAMRIGLGGGAASSMSSGTNQADLDFDSVQRDNAEIERRCQEVINSCIALDDGNPILSIHDVGAGGLSNACPELIEEIGAVFELRNINNEEKSMPPLEIWCNEAQERYVLAISPKNQNMFESLCQKERCPFAHIGTASGDQKLKVGDTLFENTPIDLNLKDLLGNPPQMTRDVKKAEDTHSSIDSSSINIDDSINRILHMPAVASKTFLITIADRSITGLIARDQMVGPYQTPISDAAVTVNGFKTLNGEAFAMGERTALALINAPASGRMAILESLTNIACTNVKDLSNIKLSANWMCACGEEGEDAKLFETVQEVGMNLCPELGISIPVGKDSLSMKTVFKNSKNETQKITSPLSLIISAFSPVMNASKTVTPDLKKEMNSKLFLLDLGEKKNRLGGSSLYQAYNSIGNECPDLVNVQTFKNFFNCIQELIDQEKLLAYHDRSDGGLFVTISEMCFGGRIGADINISQLGDNPLSILFSEELGAIVQVDQPNLDFFHDLIEHYGLKNITHNIGTLNQDKTLNIKFKDSQVINRNIHDLLSIWSETTYHMQSNRDNPSTAKEEFESLKENDDPGIQYKVNFTLPKNVSIKKEKPKIAILREQGVNGHVEMAAAFTEAGFEAHDVHMSQLLNHQQNLKHFQGLVACGGFSYGDVLGAGVGWASSILYHPKLKDLFHDFFHRENTFALGVCNGCQMLSKLKAIIPGANHWPEFKTNLSEQFEARFVSLEVMPSQSIFFKDMEGSIIAVPVAHGEGRIEFNNENDMNHLKQSNQLSLRYVDHHGKPALTYPLNPNGSVDGLTGFTSIDGRVTIMMPHPERAFKNIQLSYSPWKKDNEFSPWMKMFMNAYDFVQ